MNCYDPQYSEEEIENFDWQKHLLTHGVDVMLDISQQGITRISNFLYEKCPNLEYLYLEGNEISELGKDFFPSLRELKWLDIRNNKLKAIPKTIVDHPSLQVLLLQGNQLNTVPLEVGSVTSLRGIQLAHNPLDYPPPHILNQGVSSTIDFLRKQWQTLQSPQHIQLISEAHPQLKTLTPKNKSSGVRQSKSAVSKTPGIRRPSNTHSSSGKLLSTANLSKCISVRPISQGNQCKQKEQTLQTVTARNNWFTDEESDFETSPVSIVKRKKSLLRKKSLSNFGKTNRTEVGVQPKQLRDIWIEKIRQLLITQETILQRRKNAEALKVWQDEAKMQQQIKPKRGSEGEINFPYDTDPEYRKMMSRKDITKNGEDGIQSRHSTLHYIRHEEPINTKIMTIMSALQELQHSQSTSSLSPRSEQKSLAQEIAKIREIQRSLNALKLKNFGQLNMPS